MSQSINSSQRWLITFAVMLVTIVEVLDMTIVNIALPDMMGSLSASSEQITWIITSYVVSSAIIMPLTGFLINFLGRKKLLLINIVGFLITSALCGIATSLQEIVIFRTLQGIFGASLVPLSQYILRDTFPPDQLVKAMAIWGIGIMAGPVLGPTIGGFITEHFSWRWIFYINIPVCFLAFILSSHVISETPTHNTKLDLPGLLLMAVGVGALQIFLDRGNTVDWFSSSSIRWLCLLFTGSLILFIIRGVALGKNNIINLSLFKNRNFTTGCLLLTLFGSSIFGIIALQPLLMENLMSYPSDLSGLIMAPRGVASAFGMALVTKLAKRFDLRTVITVGISCCAIGTYLMTQFNLVMSYTTFIGCSILQGFGMGLFFIPISTITFATLPHNDYAEASGLFSFWRSLGISIGVSSLSTLLSRQTQINWHRLNAHITHFNPNLHLWLSHHHFTLSDKTTLKLLTGQIAQQATMIGFINTFYAVTFGFIIMLPLVWLLKKPKEQDSSFDLSH